MRRSGFTLIELLVATGVFLLGFTAAFGLFLVAMRYRTLSDSMSRLAWATSSLVQEMQIGIPDPGGTSPEPSKYVGSGRLQITGSPTNTLDLTRTEVDRFYPYQGSPGVWYLVETCTDLVGADAASTPTLHLSLITLIDDTVDPNGSEYNQDGLPLRDLDRRLRLVTDAQRAASTASADFMISEPLGKEAIEALIRRGLAMRTTAVVARRPWWM